MKILFVCGKGGVGKSAVATAMGRYFANHGGACVISLSTGQIFPNFLGVTALKDSPAMIHQNLYAMLIDKEKIIDQYISENFKFSLIRNWILKHPLYPHLTAIAPGFKETLILDRIFSYATTEYMDRWNTIIVDMPSTGHGINLLNITEKASGTIKFGPLRRRLLLNRQKLRDPEFCRAVVVTLAEDTPVKETRELILSLQETAHLAIDSLVVNRIDCQPVSIESSHEIAKLDDNKLEKILSENLNYHSVPTAKSVRYALNLQQSRAEAAWAVIRKLQEWWQEPLIMFQNFTFDTEEDLSTLICGELDRGGYYAE